jgi:hypothetical protein
MEAPLRAQDPGKAEEKEHCWEPEDYASRRRSGLPLSHEGLSRVLRSSPARCVLHRPSRRASKCGYPLRT